MERDGARAAALEVMAGAVMEAPSSDAVERPSKRNWVAANREMMRSASGR